MDLVNLLKIKKEIIDEEFSENQRNESGEETHSFPNQTREIKVEYFEEFECKQEAVDFLEAASDNTFIRINPQHETPDPLPLIDDDDDDDYDQYLGHVDRLCNLVEVRKCLWDQRDPEYHNRLLRKAMWKEVSKEMQLTEDEVKRQWRDLRCTFRRELIKMMRKKNKPTLWFYFNDLAFLVDTMKLSKFIVKYDSFPDMITISNEDLVKKSADRGDAPPSTTSQACIPSSGSGRESVATLNLPIPTTSSSGSDRVAVEAHNLPVPTTSSSGSDRVAVEAQNLTIPATSSAKRKYSFEDGLSTDELEAKKAKCLEQKSVRNEDEDYQFLMSLLPHLRDIPKNRKLLVRRKMLDAVVEELQLQESRTSS